MTVRVALLTREFPPEVYGGAGVHVEYLARELDRRPGIDLAVHAFGLPRPSPLVGATYEPWDAIDARTGPGAVLGTLSVDVAMAAAVAGVDVVHSHTWYAAMGGHLAGIVHDVPHVTTAHSLEPLRPWKREQLGGGYRLSSWCERTAIEGADAVIAVSEGMRADVLRCYPDVDPARVQVIHNGIDPDEYRPVDDHDQLPPLGVDPDRPYVLFVGRITRQKGITHLLDAFALLDGEPQLVLLAGQPDTAEIAAEVADAVGALQAATGRVVWLDEMVSRPAVVQLMAHAAVFVCPSVYEPFGLINVEAMACGTPVVASAVGGIPEIVVDGVTGRLVSVDADPADPSGTPRDRARFAADLASAIDDVLADPTRAATMGQAGRDRAVDLFGWSEVAARTEDLYRALL